MVNGIDSSISSLQILRATQAFKSAINSSPKVNDLLNEIEDKVSVTSTESSGKVAKTQASPLNGQYVNEIKQYAQKYTGADVSEEDIRYALKYGRSILVSQTV